MFFGIRRTETPLGLHPRPCRTCSTDRVVSERRWVLVLFSFAVFGFEAVWTGCSDCRRSHAVPLLHHATALTFALVFVSLYIHAGLLSLPALLSGIGLLAMIGALGASWKTSHTERLGPIPLPRSDDAGTRDPSIKRSVKTIGPISFVLIGRRR